MMDDDWQEKLVVYVREHGPSVLLSPRARREQEAFQKRLQAIMDGPIPVSVQPHGALRRAEVSR
jgi:hypothetical protein